MCCKGMLSIPHHPLNNGYPISTILARVSTPKFTRCKAYNFYTIPKKKNIFLIKKIELNLYKGFFFFLNYV